MEPVDIVTEIGLRAVSNMPAVQVDAFGIALIEQAITEAVQAEREECARIADARGDFLEKDLGGKYGVFDCRDIAASIRARGAK